MRYWITGFIVVASELMAWPAMAQPPEDGVERTERGRGAEMRERMSEIRERMSEMRERMERMRREFDKNSDGRLNDEERAAAWESMRERRDRAEPDGPSTREEHRRDADRGPEGRRWSEAQDGDRDRRLEGHRRERRLDGPRPELGGPQPRGPVDRRGPMGADRGWPEPNIDALFVWFDGDGDGMLSRGEFSELAQFLRRHRRGPPPGAMADFPGGPRFGRPGMEGPPADGFRRGQDEGPPGPPRDREFGRRGHGPDGPPRGDRPRRDGQRRERDDHRDDRRPRGDDGPPDRPGGEPDQPV